MRKTMYRDFTKKNKKMENNILDAVQCGGTQL